MPALAFMSARHGIKCPLRGSPGHMSLSHVSNNVCFKVLWVWSICAAGSGCRRVERYDLPGVSRPRAVLPPLPPPLALAGAAGGRDAGAAALFAASVPGVGSRPRYCTGAQHPGYSQPPGRIHTLLAERKQNAASKLSCTDYSKGIATGSGSCISMTWRRHLASQQCSVEPLPQRRRARPAAAWGSAPARAVREAPASRPLHCALRASRTPAAGAAA